MGLVCVGVNFAVGLAAMLSDVWSRTRKRTGLGACGIVRGARSGWKRSPLFFPALPSHSTAQGSLLVMRLLGPISHRLLLPSEHRLCRAPVLILALRVFSKDREIW